MLSDLDCIMIAIRIEQVKKRTTNNAVVHTCDMVLNLEKMTAMITNRDLQLDTYYLIQTENNYRDKSSYRTNCTGNHFDFINMSNNNTIGLSKFARKWAIDVKCWVEAMPTTAEIMIGLFMLHEKTNLDVKLRHKMQSVVNIIK